MLRTESYRKGIIYSSIGNFISKFLFFLQGIMVAYYFGAQSKTDVYFYSISFITLIAYFINTLDSSVLIPESMRLSEQKGKNESMKFLNLFFYFYLLLGTLLSVVFFLEPVKIFLLLSKFDLTVLTQNNQMLLFSIPLLTLIILTGFLGNIMASYKYFTVPTIVSSVNNIFAILFLLLFHNLFNVTSLYIGLLISYSLNLFLLIYLMRKKLQWSFSFKLQKLEKRIINNIFFAQGGNALSLLSSILPIYALSGFGAGVIASVNFGQKTAEAPNQGTVQFSSVLGIKFNELYAKHDYDSLNKIFLSSVKFLLFVCTPFSAIMFLFSDEIISLLFRHGAFSAESAELSSKVFKLFGFLLPLYGVNTVVARLFMAGQKLKEAFYNQLLLNLLIIILTIIGIKYFGVAGFPFAFLAVYTFSILSYYAWMNFVFPFIRYIEIFAYIVELIVLNGLIGWFIYWLKNLFFISSLLNLISGVSIYFILLLLINYFLKVNDDIAKYTIKFLRKKIRHESK
ncbi:MAG: hypothetical protein HY063_13620 [Bacteroidetes bacterium]|nr:hypothetical protein [Bacteroidota bacterium]